MLARYSGIFLSAILLQAGALQGQPITDTGITAAVAQALLRDQGVSPGTVDVNTTNGIVTLSGNVNNLMIRDRVMMIAEGIRGVQAIVPQIAVTPVGRPDEDIRRDIETSLLEDPATESYKVGVTVRGAVATLTGRVGSYAERRLAERVAEGVKGVKKIDNNIAIQYPHPNSDGQIAADANARIHWDVWINGSRVTATATNGVVTLHGVVNSAIAKSRAYDDAWVDGVKAVNDTDLKVEPQEQRAAMITSDNDIRRAVLEAFRFDPRLSPFLPKVSVSVTDGVVLLSGHVGNLKAKNAAQQDARNIAGTGLVRNYLDVIINRIE